MTVSDTIGPGGTVAVLLSAVIVFGKFFSISMDSYWAEYLYNTAHEPSKTAACVAKKASSIWTGYGFITLYVIAGAFTTASFYNVFYDSHGKVSDMNYTIGVSLMICTIGLDKVIPVMIHYYSYKDTKWLCGFFGLISWLTSVATIATVGSVVSSTGAYLLIPYLVYNSAVNLTCWSLFLFIKDGPYECSSTEIEAGKPPPVSMPYSPVRSNGAYFNGRYTPFFSKAV